MEESHGEGLASRTDPESCVDGREAGGEALTGAHTGQPLSREIPFSRSADAVIVPERPPNKEWPQCVRGGGGGKATG